MKRYNSKLGYRETILLKDVKKESQKNVGKDEDKKDIKIEALYEFHSLIVAKTFEDCYSVVR